MQGLNESSYFKKNHQKSAFSKREHFYRTILEKQKSKNTYMPNGCIAFNFSPGGIGAIIETSKRNRNKTVT